MPSAAARRPIDDPTIYPSTDDMGDPTLQVSISILLIALIERWLAARGTPAFVGMNTFFYWKQFDPTESVAPDVYVLPGVSLSQRPPSWKVFETGKLPSFALEVVSGDVEKDYLVSPKRYDRLGAPELVVFDPYHRAGRDRLLWQVFRRIKNRGLVRVEATNADRVRSRGLGCFLRAVGEGDDVRLRLATGPAGETLVPTDEEVRAQAEAERERAKSGRERAEAERERAKSERDEERAARERLEVEVARLRAELAGRGRRRR
jgi:hypothetical protein